VVLLPQTTHQISAAPPTASRRESNRPNNAEVPRIHGTSESLCGLGMSVNRRDKKGGRNGRRSTRPWQDIETRGGLW
jgi:hypothetical protein